MKSCIQLLGLYIDFLRFASRNVSASTGIFLNSEMADFSAPGYPKPVRQANYIKPGKRPQSSKTPTILIDGSTGLPIMAVGGGEGGPQMITAVVQVEFIFLSLVKAKLSS